MEAISVEIPEGWMEKLNSFNTLREQAYSQIDSGINLEQQGRHSEAISSYEAGLQSIDKALQIYLESVRHNLWDKYYEHVQKMKHTRKEVLSRLTDLQNPVGGTSSGVSVPNAPPSYAEATHGDTSSPYSSVSSALTDMKLEAEGTVIYVQENVRMYFIAPDGNVGSLSTPAPLTIAQFQDGSEEKPRYYLQIGDWIYPLLPGLSPILHSEFGAFIIPDVHSPVEGSAVGLILPEDADSSVYEILDDIIQGIVRQRGAPPPRPPPPYSAPVTQDIPQTSLSRRISQGIVIGAEYLSWGLLKGAEKAGEFLNSTTPKVIAKITPEAEPKPIPPTVKKSMKVARNVTGTAVQVTGYVACKIGAATMALGRMLAPHVQTHGTKLLTNVSGMTEEQAAGRVGGALEVTAGAVEGVGTIYSALERSAAILGTNLASNTVSIVQHKYGQPAGEVTDDTLYTVGNAVAAGRNASCLTVKGFAKKAAKGAGKGVLEDYNKKNKDPENDPDDAGPSKPKS